MPRSTRSLGREEAFAVRKERIWALSAPSPSDLVGFEKAKEKEEIDGRI